MGEKEVKSPEKGNRYAECPYYLGDGMKKIRCEGIVDGCEVDLIFDDCREKAAYMREHCNDFEKCQSCRIHQALDRKWGEKE